MVFANRLEGCANFVKGISLHDVKMSTWRPCGIYLDDGKQGLKHVKFCMDADIIRIYIYIYIEHTSCMEHNL